MGQKTENSKTKKVKKNRPGQMSAKSVPGKVNGLPLNDSFIIYFVYFMLDNYYADSVGNESVPIQLAQCWFPELAISNAKI